MRTSERSSPASESNHGGVLERPERHWVRSCLAASVVLFSLLIGGCQSDPVGSERLGTIQVPEGFEVALAAGPDLVSYPMLGTLDDRGRLFLCESSGNTLKTPEMAANPDYTIRLLEDTDGDGFFDKSKIFADKLTLPAGAVWYRGSLFVASPPDLIRFDDVDDDGVSDHREIIATGWNLSANAASLHGPFMGPDGRLYLTDGRHGFKIRTQEGELLEGKASRIWRLKPDGSELEWVSGGGFDNPVEIVFTAAGEAIGTMTYFTNPKNGQRDALLHYVEGGVYPKWHPVVDEFKRTGDLMPVMTKFARIAPAGLALYRGKSFGAEYQESLFSAQFNPHRVQRHILDREGATFRTEDKDFVTSTDPDFHPTDVIEDADGSLLIVDTGGWFIHGCPVSRIAKPEIRGAVYRVQKQDVEPMEDPRGKRLGMEELPLPELAAHLEDARPAVRHRALELLVERGEQAVPSLQKIRESSDAPEIRSAVVFGLARIGTPDAKAAVRAALEDEDFQVRIAAGRAVGLARDSQAVARLRELVREDEPPVRRQAATALGRIGNPSAIEDLLAAATHASDRFVEHAIIYALIQLKEPEPLLRSLTSKNAGVRKVALVALDQMDDSPLTRRHVAPFLRDPSSELREKALWVFSHHPDWSGEVLAFLRARLRAASLTAGEKEAVRETLLSFCGESEVQQLVADSLTHPALNADRRLFLLGVIDSCSLAEMPSVWKKQLARLLQAEDAVTVRAIELIRARRLEGLNEKLQTVASDTSRSDAVRAGALLAIASQGAALGDDGFRFLLGLLDSDSEADLRLTASQALGRAQLNESQLLFLAQESLPRADALILPNLLDAFRENPSGETTEAMVTGLLEAGEPLTDMAAARLEEILQDAPAPIQSEAQPLLAQLRAGEEQRQQRIEKLEPLLEGGDVGRGRRVFFGKKAACSSCHTIGMEGGHVGPDLTAVGAIRSGPDLLEAIVFPSASFVPGHEVYRVETKTDIYSGVRGERTPDAVEIISGPNDRIRIPREEIVSMEPASVSLMPDGFDRDLTEQELADLLAFLQAQKSRSSAKAD